MYAFFLFPKEKIRCFTLCPDSLKLIDAIKRQFRREIEAEAITPRRLIVKRRAPAPSSVKKSRNSPRKMPDFPLEKGQIPPYPLTKPSSRCYTIGGHWGNPTTPARAEAGAPAIGSLARKHPTPVASATGKGCYRARSNAQTLCASIRRGAGNR